MVGRKISHSAINCRISLPSCHVSSFVAGVSGNRLTGSGVEIPHVNSNSTPFDKVNWVPLPGQTGKLFIIGLSMQGRAVTSGKDSLLPKKTQSNCSTLPIMLLSFSPPDARWWYYRSIGPPSWVSESLFMIISWTLNKRCQAVVLSKQSRLIEMIEEIYPKVLWRVVWNPGKMSVTVWVLNPQYSLSSNLWRIFISSSSRRRE